MYALHIGAGSISHLDQIVFLALDKKAFLQFRSFSAADEKPFNERSDRPLFLFFLIL